MKQRIHADIIRIEIGGTTLKIADQPTIELEFSAIDAGGGFHDPILDFVYTIELAESQNISQKKQSILLQLADPGHKKNQTEIIYEGNLNKVNKDQVEGMGRLKDEAVSRGMVEFVMRSLR